MKNERNTLSLLSNKILALLFLSNKEIYYSELANNFNTTEQEIKFCIYEINNFLEPSSLTISITEKSAMLIIKNDFIEFVPKNITYQSQLSEQALETLAVIIFKQPCTKQEIEQIRKVDCEKTIQSLLNAGLIKKIATINQTGNPVLYSVTEKCIHTFGFKSYEEMLGWLKKQTDIETINSFSFTEGNFNFTAGKSPSVRKRDIAVVHDSKIS